MKFVLRLILFPFRLPFYVYYKLSLLFPAGDTLIHRVPDRFTMTRQSGILSMFVSRWETNYAEYLSLLTIIRLSRHLRKIVLFIPEIEASWAETQEIAEHIRKIADTEKEIEAYSDGGNLKTLYLMSAASKRTTSPHSNFTITFPSMEPFFFGELLRKLGVQAEVITAGKFKSAGEMFSRRSFSKPARENMLHLLKGMRKEILDTIQKSPGMDSATNSDLVSFLLKNTIVHEQDLRNLGFFHEAMEENDFRDQVSGKTPGSFSDHIFSRTPAKNQNPEPTAKRPKVRITNESRLVKRYRRERVPLLRLRSLPAAALVSMEGPISMGRTGDEPAAYGISARAFQDLFASLENSNEEAVIIYINSPGGGSDASELIYQSIRRLSERKPVLAVMGSVAASGGYYIACAANRIYGSPLTMTGSIGVVAIRPNLKGLYRKLGISKERIFFDPTRDILSEAAPLSPASKKLLQKSIEQTYGLFLSRVAQGRQKEVRDVHEFGQGRVWLGRDLQENGLMDSFGDLTEVISEYRKAAGYDERQEFQINIYPEIKTDLRTLLGEKMHGLPGFFAKKEKLAWQLLREGSRGTLAFLLETFLIKGL